MAEPASQQMRTFFTVDWHQSSASTSSRVLLVGIILEEEKVGDRCAHVRQEWQLKGSSFLRFLGGLKLPEAGTQVATSSRNTSKHQR
mmetsp:Transcript_80836/g.127723  ORF Transcript_80836/g.127723 Transcript_80836/m.127723 type:complete len:87 (-) Transcript_80836:190-450(-)